jgi:hypothetical protein
MSNRHPNGGPSFSAPTYKNRPGLAPPPERKQAELEQAAPQNKGASGRCCAMTQNRGRKNIKKKLGRLS